MFANSVRVSKFVKNRKKMSVVCINNHGNQQTNNQIDMTISFRINKNYYFFLIKNYRNLPTLTQNLILNFFLTRLDRNQPSKSFWPSKCFFAKIQLMQKIID